MTNYLVKIKLVNFAEAKRFSFPALSPRPKSNRVTTRSELKSPLADDRRWKRVETRLALSPQWSGGSHEQGRRSIENSTQKTFVPLKALTPGNGMVVNPSMSSTSPVQMGWPRFGAPFITAKTKSLLKR